MNLDFLLQSARCGVERGFSDLESIEIHYDILRRKPLGVLELRSSKSNAQSLIFRKEGNEFYSNGNFRNALAYYSKSIACAEPDTEFLAVAYANRSAVVFEMKLYEACLENIKLARQSNYPRHLRDKLVIRERKCLELMATEKKEIFKIELCCEPHPTVPFIANCLYRGEKGIHTRKNLAPANLVAVEEPFCTTLGGEDVSFFCWQCLKSCFTSMPCQNCCISMFCSKECEEKSFPVHKYECQVINTLTKSGGIAFCVRMLLTALELFESVADFQGFCENPDNHKDDIFEMNKLTFDSKEYLKLVCGADSHRNDPHTPEEIFISVAFAKYLLLDCTDLYNRFSTEAEQNFLVERLLHFGKLYFMKNISQTMVPTNGCRMYGLSKYLRHSCEPNVARIESGGKSYIVAIRPIAPNQELFENYWYHQNIGINVKTWQEISTKYFKFSCYCKRCILGKSRESYLKFHRRIPTYQILYDVSPMTTYDVKYAKANFKRFARFISKYRKYSNCGQLQMAEDCLFQCLLILYTKLPDAFFEIN